MKCKLSEKCEFGNLCKDATRHDSLTVLGCSSFKTKKPMTEQEWLQTCDTEQLAEVLYHMVCFTEPLFVKCMRKQTDADAEKAIIEWLKQPHREE